MLIDDGFLSEFRITDKKEENEMMDLNGSKVGDKFNCDNGHRPELVFILGDNYCLSLNGELFLYKADGKLIQHVSENGEHLVSKHEPRHWLKDLPDADLFELYGSEYISCAKTGDWYADNSELDIPVMFLNKDKMPKLTGDEYKQSKISIADLREWQKANG